MPVTYCISEPRSGAESLDSFRHERKRMVSENIHILSGDDALMVPPVPIPNTVVKHQEAESTWLATAREDR